MDIKACAITGHCPGRFKWKYKEDNNGCKRLKKRMRDQFTMLYTQGVHRFYVGGALGVEMWAGEILLRLKELPEYSGIELMIVLPFERHDVDWDDRSRKRMDFLIHHSAQTVIIGTAEKQAIAYKDRNYYMVNHADCLLAVYDNNRSLRSGTGMTVRYAEKKGLPITLIHPDTAVVSKIGKDAQESL